MSCPNLGCCPTVSDAAAAAAACNSGTTPLSTYLMAVGASLQSLTEIAEAGGTSAYFVTDPAQFDARFEQFRADALAANDD